MNTPLFLDFSRLIFVDLGEEKPESGQDVLLYIYKVVVQDNDTNHIVI